MKLLGYVWQAVATLAIVLLLIKLSVPAPVVGVNLPPPKTACKALVDAAKFPGGKAPVNADTLGLLYSSALKSEGVNGKSQIVPGQMVQALSDVLGCFVKANGS